MYELLVSVAIDRCLSRVGDTRFALNTSGKFQAYLGPINIILTRVHYSGTLLKGWRCMTASFGVDTSIAL